MITFDTKLDKILYLFEARYITKSGQQVSFRPSMPLEIVSDFAKEHNEPEIFLEHCGRFLQYRFRLIEGIVDRARSKNDMQWNQLDDNIGPDDPMNWPYTAINGSLDEINRHIYSLFRLISGTNELSDFNNILSHHLTRFDSTIRWSNSRDIIMIAERCKSVIQLVMDVIDAYNFE